MSTAAPTFTILLPVHRPPVLLPYAIASVQAQARRDFELFVICDGAPPETAMCARELAAKDERILVFEHPKGERYGEVYRHRALQGARGEYVCHIGDDDLWLPNFLTEMASLLQAVDFGNLSHLEVLADGTLSLVAGDLANDHARRQMMAGRENFFGLMFGGYRLSAYRTLPVGWTPSPPGVPSDFNMWQKFLARDDLRFGTRIAVCAIKFAAGRRREWSLDRRIEEMADWARRVSQPGSFDSISQPALLHLSRTAYLSRLHAQNLIEAAKASETAVEQLKNELIQLRSELRINQRRLDKLHRKLNAMRQTLSWRLTRPLRRLARMMVR